jgi:hypothetical protein
LPNGSGASSSGDEPAAAQPAHRCGDRPPINDLNQARRQRPRAPYPIHIPPMAQRTMRDCSTTPQPALGRKQLDICSAQNSVPDALSQLLVWPRQEEPALVLNCISPFQPLSPPRSPSSGSVACCNHPAQPPPSLPTTPALCRPCRAWCKDKFHAV